MTYGLGLDVHPGRDEQGGVGVAELPPSPVRIGSESLSILPTGLYPIKGPLSNLVKGLTWYLCCPP